MKRAIIIFSAVFLAVIGWYLIWNSMMAEDVARVKATIAHHDARIKTMHRTMTLKAEDVYATGFPFGFRVRVDRPTLSKIWGKESYAVSFDHVELEKQDDAQGRYAVLAPNTLDALYAIEGSAPEKYTVTVNELPGVLVRAQGSSMQCSGLPGSARCEAVSDEAPLISYAAQMPRNVVLDVSLNGKTKQIGFTFMPLNIPVFMTIPAEMSGPLEVFVGMLREAMVYQ